MLKVIASFEKKSKYVKILRFGRYMDSKQGVPDQKYNIFLKISYPCLGAASRELKLKQS